MDDKALTPSTPPGKPEDRLPLVSVCIPVYNGVPYIAEAIESVLKQTCQDFEIVVCDNCSTDDTLKVVEGYADPRIRVYRNERNLGASTNYNRVVSLARGKYFKLLCADDIIYPDCLKVQADVLEDPQNSSVVLVFCSRDIVRSDGKRMMTWGYRRTRRHSGGELMRKYVRYSSNLMGEPSCLLFRRDALPVAGQFQSELWYCDIHFYARMLLHGDGYSLAKPYCIFRLSEVSTTIREAKEGVGRQRRDYREFVDMLRTEPQFQKFKIGYLDVLAGRVMIGLTTRLRRIIYALSSR